MKSLFPYPLFFKAAFDNNVVWVQSCGWRNKFKIKISDCIEHFLMDVVLNVWRDWFSFVLFRGIQSGIALVFRYSKQWLFPGWNQSPQCSKPKQSTSHPLSIDCYYHKSTIESTSAFTHSLNMINSNDYKFQQKVLSTIIKDIKRYMEKNKYISKVHSKSWSKIDTLTGNMI